MKTLISDQSESKSDAFSEVEFLIANHQLRWLPSRARSHSNMNRDLSIIASRQKGRFPIIESYSSSLENSFLLQPLRISVTLNGNSFWVVTTDKADSR